MRKYLVLAVVPILLLAACKSSSAGGSSPGTTAGAVTVDTRAPGVTADTIKVGVTYVDLEAIRDVTKVNHGDYETAYTAEFDAINAAGGINGRKLEPIIVPVNPIGTAASDAACTKLTQDDQVFVTLGFFLNDSVLCYVDTNDTAVIGGEMNDERLAQAKAPWYSTDPGSDMDTSVVTSLIDSGDLDGKVAVIARQAEVPLNDSLLALLKDKGVDVVSSAVTSAPENDQAAGTAEAQTIAERFKEAGAEKVLVVGQAATAFGRGLNKTDYRPQLIFSNLNAAATIALDKTIDPSILDSGLSGGIYGPSDARLALDDQLTKDCFARQRGAGLTIIPTSQVAAGDPDQFQSSSTACSQVALLKAILEKAGTDLNYGTFRAAGDSLGAVDLPTFPADAWHFGAPPSADGDPAVYAYVYDPATSLFVAKAN